MLALESGLDDTYVVLQGFPKPGRLLVAHPDAGFCALACAEGVQHFDADAEAWTGADPDEASRDARRSLGPEVGTRLITGLAFLAETPISASHGAASTGVVFAETGPQLGALVEAYMPGQAPGEARLGQLIRQVSPGAADYARGWVTDAQQRWRGEGRGQMAAGAQAPAADPPPAPADTAGLAADQIEVATTPAPSARRDVPDLSSDATEIRLLRQVTERICRGRRIHIFGVEIEPEEVVDPMCMLPAILVAAAQDWAPVVARGQGKGGFHLRLRSDNRPMCILGYRVAALELSAPLLLVLPVVDLLRRSVQLGEQGAEELCLDRAVQTFRRWLEENRFNSDAVAEIDIRIAL